jgi:small subunit ribosomal protein S2
VVDTNYDPSLVDYSDPGQRRRDSRSAVYTRVADAVLEGKAAAPQYAAAQKDEFIELDAEGNPMQKEAARERDDRRNRPPAQAGSGQEGPAAPHSEPWRCQEDRGQTPAEVETPAAE